MSKLKKNNIREGLKIDKKLKNGFYYFLIEKNIDWAIILGAFFLTLPYIASASLIFLISKISIQVAMCFFIVKYLKTWNSIRQYKKKKDELDFTMKGFLNKDNFEKVDFEKVKEKQKKIKQELNVIKQRTEKKANQYKSFEEYVKYNKIDFIELEKILSEDSKNYLKALGISFSFLFEILVLRTIPKEENNNYKRLLTILGLTVIFFIVFTIEYWITNHIN